MSAPADSSAKSQDGTSSSGRASYKAQLDEAAERAQNPDGHNGGGSEEGLVDKVSQYIPAVGKVLGKKEDDEPGAPSASTAVPGPPERPHDDAKIQEFVRDQHRSKDIDKIVDID